MLEGSVSVVSPGAYAVADGGGEVDGCVGQGLFYRDVRHLSEFHLEVNGELPVTVASRARGSAAEFVQSVGADGAIAIVRRRSLGGGMTEEAVEAWVELECAADFRDVFDVRGYREASERGELAEKVEDGCLRFILPAWWVPAGDRGAGLWGERGCATGPGAKPVRCRRRHSFHGMYGPEKTMGKERY
jgi:N-terminal domain of (some) glycogen debranching enzymes